jgi:hypothetical protein
MWTCVYVGERGVCEQHMLLILRVEVAGLFAHAVACECSHCSAPEMSKACHKVVVCRSVGQRGVP